MKYTKLYEHGVGPKIVTAKELADLQGAKNFTRVYRVDGEASEAEAAAYRSKNLNAGKKVEPEAKTSVAKPTGAALPTSGQSTGAQLPPLPPGATSEAGAAKKQD